MRPLIVVVLAVGLIASAACGRRDAVRAPAADSNTVPPTAGVTAAASPQSVAAGPRRLAFVSDREGPFRLYTMNADGSDVLRLSDQPVEQMPFSVSRDGTQIAAAAAGGDGGDKQPLHLYRMDVAGGATTPIGEAPASDSDLLFPAPFWRADDAAIPVLNYSICYEFPSGGGEVREQDFETCLEAGILGDGPDGRWAVIGGDGLLVGKGTDYGGGKKIDTVLPASAKDNALAGLAYLALQTFGAWRPLWSPDGTQIAYLDGDAGAGQAGLAVIPSGGGTSRLLVSADKNSIVIPSAWSEDGATVFFSGMEKQSSIDAVDVASGQSRRIAGGDGHTYLYPRWVVDAPASARASVPFERAAQASDLKTELAGAPGRLVYEGGDNRRGFFSAKPGGTDERSLSGDAAYPSFTSADGKWLSYTGHDPGTMIGTIVVINTATGERRELGKGASPTISPSGQQLAYWERPSQRDSTWVLVRVDLDTLQRRELFRQEALDPVEPSWSPDGRRIAFFRESPTDRPHVTRDTTSRSSMRMEARCCRSRR